MRDYSYFFENSQLLNLFVSAFDDAFVYRYDASRTKREKIAVRYENGPKHRVLADLNDRSKTLTLPVVTVEQTSLNRDSNRVFNKDQFFYRTNLDSTHRMSKIPTPIPVSMDVSVNIIAYFKEDIDQIVQNFIVNCNPYIIVSWKTPDDFELPFLEEIRSEIQWSGTTSFTNPKDLSPDVKWRISAETSFTIKGWMFKSLEQNQAPIYTVRTDFIASSLGQQFCSDNYLDGLSGEETEMVTVSAYPSFTNIFYATDSTNIPVRDDLIIKKEFENQFLLYGKRFDYNNTWYLSSGTPNFYTDYQLVSTAKSPFISAYRMPDSWVATDSDNVVRLTIPENSLSATGDFKFITANEAGWGIYPVTKLTV